MTHTSEAAKRARNKLHRELCSCEDDKGTSPFVDARDCKSCTERIIDEALAAQKLKLPFGRDQLGREVRKAWVRWAKAQPEPKPSWLVPYDEMSEPDKEADRQIGEHIAQLALAAQAIDWLPGKPTKAGCYYWSESPKNADIPRIVPVQTEETYGRDAGIRVLAKLPYAEDYQDVSTLPGIWAGPIPRPPRDFPHPTPEDAKE